MKQTKTILDVSRYQGSIDWEAVRASGRIDGAMLRAVSTSSACGGVYIDSAFARNYAECRRLGIPAGAYYYTYARTKAQADAELGKLREALAGKTFALPIAVDVEDARLRALEPQALTALAAYAADTLERWGLYAMVYTYTDFANRALDMAALARYDVWLADYTGKTPAVSFAYGMHQYTSKGSVPGVTGNVDLSRTSRDYPAMLQRAGLTRLREGV